MSKHKVLLVDDEQFVLDGLKRGLRNYNPYFNFNFVNSGQQALTALQQEAHDIIISDMKMPEMDGAALLHKVRKNHPDTIRIVLSGEASNSHIMRSVMLAHRYLAKPCPPDVIYNAILDSLKFRDCINEQYRGLISNVNKLPSLPKLYQEIMELLEDPNVTLQQVSAIIEQDVAMSAKILQIINSAFFALPRKIQSVKDAVSLLGLDILMGLILHNGIFASIDSKLAKEFELEEISNYSFKVADYCNRIANIVITEPDKTSNSPYIAGILHKMGILIFANIAPEKYKAVYELKRQQNISLADAEQEVIGQTHAELGAYLLSIWGLPTPVVESVLYYTNGDNSTDNPNLNLVILYIANQLANNDEDTDPSSNIINDNAKNNLLEKLTSHPWIKQHNLGEKIPEIVELINAT